MAKSRRVSRHDLTTINSVTLTNTNLAAGKTLVFDGTSYVPGYPSNLFGSSVSISNLAVGQTLVYSGSTWNNQYLETFKITSVALTGRSIALGDGADYLTITGVGFAAGCAVYVDSLAATNVTVVSATTITATAPVLFSGTYHILLRNTNGTTTIAYNALSYTFIPLYTLSTGGITSINEGQSFTVGLSTNVPTGNLVPYEISGVSSADLVGAPSLSDYFIVNNGAASKTFTVAADLLTEGTEVFTLTVASVVSVSVTINDTSVNVPVYLLSSGGVSTSYEGGSFTITLTTTYLNPGNVSYLITGVSSADISGTSLTGNFTTVGNYSSATASRTFNIATNTVMEGAKTFTLTLNSISPTQYISVPILDTTYIFSTGGVTSINEGSSFTVTLTTTNLALNTSIPYTITGVSSADIGGASLTGNFVNSSGSFDSSTATLTVNVTADVTTEGAETFTITLNTITPTVTASVVINDTSITPSPPPTVEYLVVAGGGGGATTGGGGGAGGLLTGSGFAVSGSTAYTVTIGAGGSGGTQGSPGSGQTAGSNTSFASITTYGGGYGTTHGSTSAGDGGSGGGAPVTTGGSVPTGGRGVYPGSGYISAARQGYDGGDGCVQGGWGGNCGGGGGATQKGYNAAVGGGGTSGYGGTGAVVSITGTVSSSTSNTISTGSKTFTVASGLPFSAGQAVQVYNSGSNYMYGNVTSYSSTSLVVNIVYVTGSGTFTSWSIDQMFAGGGGGGEVYANNGIGGAGGGGDGATDANLGVAGSTNTGGGGGGGGFLQGSAPYYRAGGAGGSGIVIIAYPSSYYSLASISGTLSYSFDNGVTRPGYKVYKFTGGTGNISW